MAGPSKCLTWRRWRARRDCFPRRPAPVGRWWLPLSCGNGKVLRQVSGSSCRKLETTLHGVDDASTKHQASPTCANNATLCARQAAAPSGKGGKGGGAGGGSGGTLVPAGQVDLTVSHGRAQA